MGKGWTLPQSLLLNTEVDVLDHFTTLALEPDAGVPAKWTLPVAVVAVQVDSMVALPLFLPVQAISAFTLWACLSRLVILHVPPTWGKGAPYLSINSWVRQAEVV
jgi:hypothetical protein